MDIKSYTGYQEPKSGTPVGGYFSYPLQRQFTLGSTTQGGGRGGVDATPVRFSKVLKRRLTLRG